MTNKKPKLVYLMAASHSGSTLTAMLLGAHPHVSCVGELKAINLGDGDSYLCSCRERISQCQFWQSISKRMAEKGVDFDISNAGTDIRSGATPQQVKLLSPLVRGKGWEALRDLALGVTPHWRRNLKIIQHRNEQLIRSILDENNNEVIVDSSKIGIRLKYLLRNPNIDIKVVWIVRDGRGVANAYLNPSEFADSKTSSMRGGGSGRTQEVARDIALGANEWLRCNQEAMEVLNLMHPDAWLKVHYEDICEQTEATLDRIFDFIGVDKNHRQLDYRAVNHHMLGNGMRLDSDSKIVLDERWRRNLTKNQLTTFNKVAGNLNKSLGYTD